MYAAPERFLAEGEEAGDPVTEEQGNQLGAEGAHLGRDSALAHTRPDPGLPRAAHG